MRFLFFLSVCLFPLISFASSGDLKVYGQKSSAQIYLFTSLTCPHCANFHNKILPNLVKKYIDTNKAQLTVVDFVSSENGLMATAAVRCMNNKKTDRLENDLYANQGKWMRVGLETAKKEILKYASRQGISEKQVKNCFDDKEMLQNMLDKRRDIVSLYQIDKTPTLLIRKGSRVQSISGNDQQEIEDQLNEILEN